MQTRTRRTEDDSTRAVSPVIGVILMVAITVILAAVIAAFVLDLGGSIGAEAQAGVDISVNSSADDSVTVSVTSMGNADEIRIVQNMDSGSEDTTNNDPLSSVGSSTTLQYSSGDSGTVVAVGVTSDGTETQVASQSFDF